MVIDRQHRKVPDRATVAIIAHGAQYSAVTLTTGRFVACLALGLPGLLPLCASALELRLEAGPTRFGEFEFERIELTRRAGIGLAVSGISHPVTGPVGDLEGACPGPPCATGRIEWRSADGAPLALEFKRVESGVEFSASAGLDGGFRWLGDGAASLRLGMLPLERLPQRLRERFGLAALSGMLDVDARLAQSSADASVRLDGVEFDTPDGRFAGAGLALAAELGWREDARIVRVEARWLAGELLLGPAYLPPPDDPVALVLALRRGADSLWHFDDFRLEQAGTLELRGSARVAAGSTAGPLAGRMAIPAVRVDALQLDIARADLGRLWRQGLQSVAATAGWGQLDPGGFVDGSVRLADGELTRAELHLSGGEIDDGAGRIALQGLGARLDWNRSAASLEFGAEWADARLYRIPLGASTIGFATRPDGTLALAEPFRLPVFDGALVVEKLEWRDWSDPERELVLDARLEPVELAALADALGWTEFGGRLSGRFPGIRVADGVIDVRGGLDIDLFGGRARIDRLSIERPFGSAPALAAGIEFERLDLEQVTGAFEFGLMRGLMSGHIRDLRLLDWQPVQFDAWFETLEDSPKRKISQKAVGSLSSISGGGGAALSATLLRWFDDFPYRKAGLGCRLAANVCRMRGLRDTDAGGYLILEGRLIPRLDIVGYQRRVNWPRLLAQLAAVSGPPE